jgi:ParB family chromosome partitioning protein
MDPRTLEELANSIRQQGLMQPVIVRPGASPNAFELVAGERRWRAAQAAGLSALPAIVRKLDDRQLAEWALVENLQREDLNAMDRADAFQRLIATFHLSHEEVADRVGVERSSVTNALRLLSLGSEVKQWVREGKLSAGQAKVLAGISDAQQQKTLADRAIKQDWSVRQLEQTARLLAAGKPTPAVTAVTKGGGAHLDDLAEQIGRQLRTRVRIKPGRKKGSGTLAIEFYSIDQFDGLLTKLGVQTD